MTFWTLLKVPNPQSNQCSVLLSLIIKFKVDISKLSNQQDFYANYIPQEFLAYV
jgi:hypothetical protein